MALNFPLGRALSYYRNHPAASLAGALSVVASSAIGLIAPSVVRKAIDALSAGSPISQIWHYAFILIGIQAASGIFLFTQRLLMVGVSRHIEHRLRVDLVERLLCLPPAFYLRHRVGDLLTRAVSDVGTVRMAVGPAMMYALNTVTALVICVALMSRIDGRLTLLALAVLPLVAAATRAFGSRIHQRWDRSQHALSEYTARLQEHLVGMRVLRAYACEEAESAALGARNQAYLEASNRLIRVSAMFHPTLQALIGLSFVAVLGVGGAAVRAHTITLGQFVEFNLYLARLTWPMIAVGWVANLWQRGTASMRRIEELLAEAPPTETTELATGFNHPSTGASLTVENVSFTYPNASGPALADVSFSLAPQQRIAVVGGVGSGKSSLLSLIPRLFESDSGKILVDGRDIHDWPLGTLRRAVALVPQSSFLFSATLRENVAMARPSASDDEILQACHDAGLEVDLTELPNGLDTAIGERGVTLSGGQRQRVAIARTLLARPRLLLLDDCLSAVDASTEQTILRALPRTSLIFATHRLAAAELCDEILVLEEGHIVERGTPAELAGQSGTYARLLALQRLEGGEAESAEETTKSGPPGDDAAKLGPAADDAAMPLHRGVVNDPPGAGDLFEDEQGQT